MTNGLNYGLRRGYYGAVGLVFGLWAVFLVVVVGLGAIIQASPVAFNIIKWAGVAYLFYLGLTQWFSKATPISVSKTDGALVNRGTLIWKGIALNAVNPKGYIFMLAVIPQFIDSSAPMPPQYLAIALTFAFTDLVVMAVYTGLAAKVATYLKTERQIKFVNRLFGTLFMVAAVVLATFQQVGH